MVGSKSCQKGATRGGEKMGNVLEPQHAMKELSNESTPLEFTYNNYIKEKHDISIYNIT